MVPCALKLAAPNFPSSSTGYAGAFAISAASAPTVPFASSFLSSKVARTLMSIGADTAPAASRAESTCSDVILPLVPSRYVNKTLSSENSSISMDLSHAGEVASAWPVTQLPVPLRSFSSNTLAPVISTCSMRSRPASNSITLIAAYTRLACASHGCEPQAALPKRTSDTTSAGRGSMLIVTSPNLNSRPVSALMDAASDRASARGS